MRCDCGKKEEETLSAIGESNDGELGYNNGDNSASEPNTSGCAGQIEPSMFVLLFVGIILLTIKRCKHKKND